MENDFGLALSYGGRVEILYSNSNMVGLFYNNKGVVALENAPCLHLNPHLSMMYRIVISAGRLPELTGYVR
jgi:hypothetical protein